MFDWLVDLIGGFGEALGSVIEYLGTAISNAIFDAILQWFYTIIYGAVADFFTMIGDMGAEIFELSWVQATVELFTLFGWALFAAGVVVAIFKEAKNDDPRAGGRDSNEGLFRHDPAGDDQIHARPLSGE